MKAYPSITRVQFESFFFNANMKTAQYFIKENDDKNIIAFFCGLYFAIDTNRGNKFIYNSRVIVSPEYQGNSIMTETFFIQFFTFGKIALKNGGYWFSNTVNSLSYHGVSNICYEVYPTYKNCLTPETKEVLKTAANASNYEIVERNGDLKIVSGIPARYTENQLERIYQSNKPHIKYFIERKIDFLNGEGIPILVPLSVKNIVLTFSTILKKMFGTRLKNIPKINIPNFNVKEMKLKTRRI